MTVHTDTNRLSKYRPGGYSIPGGEAEYLKNELVKISEALNKAVDVLKLIEARLNSNGLA